MLSYRHAFHAGNHADVLKHYVLSLVLNYFNQKEKPYWMIDTHAGAGMYAFDDGFSQKNKEFENGISKLMKIQDLPTSLSQFVQLIQLFNEEKSLNFYPGSPKIAQTFCRENDKIRLFELHPTDFALLAENFKHKTRQTKIDLQDGFIGIKACLPPPTKRALVLIDPPYEVKDDYHRVVACIKDSLKRFATGTFLIWYPLLQRPEPTLMIEQLLALQNTVSKNHSYVNVSLTVQRPNDEGFGMHGSGMFIINPPWTLPNILAESMPILTQSLALDAHAFFELESNII